jgi:hypothetical protein
MKNMTFEDLEVGMRIFDLDEEAFGEIVKKDDEDRHWLMVEVLWDNEEGVDDRSYVLSGKQIGVIVKAGSPMMDDILKHMGDEIQEVADECGDDFSVVNLVDVW